jgi:hypothetical protein
MKIESKSKIKKYFKLVSGTIAILAILAAGGWYYFTTDRALKAKDVELRSIKSSTRDKVQATLQIQDEKYLKLLMEPFGWAIRNELLKEDISTVHQYIAQFVKSSAVELVLVNNADGKIISASDKKIEGMLFSDVYPNIQWEVTETQITPEGNRYFVLQPIMGFDHQIGTVFMIYRTDNDKLISNLLVRTSP